jgi:hypothetical protein
MASLDNFEESSSDSDEFEGPEGVEDAEVFNAIRGYNFEPRRRPRALVVEEYDDDSDGTERLGNSEWCVLRNMFSNRSLHMPLHF